MSSFNQLCKQNQQDNTDIFPYVNYPIVTYTE